MEPVTVMVSTYVAIKLVDQFIAQEGYGYIRKFFFPKKKYKDRLYQIIEESVIEFEAKYPIPATSKIPFYHSQILFDKLNEYILFQSLPKKESLIASFDKYPHVTPPTEEQLKIFYDIFSLKINDCKVLKKLYIKDTYREKIFDIDNALIDVKLLLQTIDEKVNFRLDQAWLNKINREAIADLGVRYTPKLNIKLDIAKIFDGIGRTQVFIDKFYTHIDNFLIKGNKLGNCDAISAKLTNISIALNDITTLYKKIDLCSVNNIPIEDFCNHVFNCQKAISESEAILWELKKKTGSKEFDSNYDLVFRDLQKFDSECSIFNSFLNSLTVKLANNPYLLIEGAAGIGKSHLLADVIQARTSLESPSLFLLGQQFVTDENPWVQILKKLQLKDSSDEFLKKLNLYGQRIGKRILIFIDAINEGNGNRFWSDNINSFMEQIKQFEWLGLILSIRSTYRGITISREQEAYNNFEICEHVGFMGVEEKAVNSFYDNYKIERPSSPNLNPEFKNPLFLKLFCEGIKNSGQTKVPIGFHGISRILNFFVDGVNKSLASPKRYNYDPSFSLVSETINALIKIKLTRDCGKNDLGNNIPLKDAHVAVQSVVEKYVNDKNFLTALVDEGLLTKNVIYDNESIPQEVVYISFERFDDHLTVKYLLESIKNIEEEFKISGKLANYFAEEYDFYRYQGIIEALSIQIPEKYGKELYELLPKISNNSYLVNSFIESLVWRDSKTIDLIKLKPYINNTICSNHETYSHFLEKLISITGLEDHPLNANFLHQTLQRHTLPNRDSIWSTELKHAYNDGSTFKQLINWAWNKNDKSYISDNSLELIATTLCWFLSSSNRELRDFSTKALVGLLETRIPILIKIIKKFEGIDDAYIWERIFAVALGCTLRTKQHKNLTELAETVYSVVFDQEYIYPHLLLRDYAREIIEYTFYLGFTSELINLSKTQPPYKSLWPEFIPSKEELENTYDKDSYGLLWYSVFSGDFSRYIIGTNSHYSEWSGCKFGESPIDRYKVFEDFKKDLSIEQNLLFSATDPIIYDQDIDYLVFEDTKIQLTPAIGRKTDEEVTANKHAFKSSLSEELLTHYRCNIEPYLDHNNNFLDVDKYFDLRIAERFIFTRVIELGWNSDQHGGFDRLIGTGRGRNSPHQERIGKKYQWIAYYEFMAKLADNFIRYEQYSDDLTEKPYIGPWDPHKRDIDPTILIEQTGIEKLTTKKKWWSTEELFDWDCTFEEWISETSTIGDLHGLIEVKDLLGDEWLVLKSQPSWQEPKVIGYEKWEQPRKEAWCIIDSYLVCTSDYKQFKEWAIQQHYMGRWMPESSDRYELFNREYYWSKAFRFFQSDYYSGKNWVQIKDRTTDQEICDVSPTSLSYFWEEEFDKSKVGTLSFLKPSSLIFDKMQLTHGDLDGTYINNDGNIVCFAAEAIYDTSTHLLVKKDIFLQMLKDNDLEIVWTLVGNKGVIGGSLSSFYGNVEFSGAFYLKNGIVDGSYEIYSS